MRIQMLLLSPDVEDLLFLDGSITRANKSKTKSSPVQMQKFKAIKIM